MEPKPAEYLDWTWEIPINSNVVSVGYVTTAEAMKRKREQGHSVADIFEQQLRMFPRFEPLLRMGALSACNMTSFRSRVHVGIAGPNWLIVGEAASVVDPITSNGVTAALRHAAEASALILRHHKRRRLPLRARISYSSRVFHVARFFNGGIETVVYQPPVRNQIGSRHSGTIYISPAWGLNLLYSRLRPNGIFSTFLFASLLGFFWAVSGSFTGFANCFHRRSERRLRFCLTGKEFRMYLSSRGSGYPILFIHGMPTSSWLWSGIIDRLRDHFTCLALDLPGLGRTPRIPYGPKQLELLAEQIEKIRVAQKVEKWHVVGHDAGSAVAVHYAYRYQEHVNHLVLLSPAMFPELRSFHLFRLIRIPVLGELLAPIISLLFWNVVMRLALETRRADLANAVEDFRAPFTGFLGAWRLMSVLRFGDPAQLLAAVPEMLPHLAVPTLIFHGAHDKAVPERFAQRASALIPQSKMAVVDSGHLFH
jgi:pimeloyl-ACP methyl ester carboxylesterase